MFVLYALRSGQIFAFTWYGRAWFLFALCEVCCPIESRIETCSKLLYQVFFSVYYRQLVRSISGPGPTNPPDLSDLQSAFRRVLRAGMAEEPLSEGKSEAPSLSKPPPGEMRRAASTEATPLARDDPRAIDFRNALRPWFHYAPWSSVQRDDIRAWLYWAIFSAPIPAPDAMPHAHAAAMEDVEELMRQRTGCTFKEGSNPECKPVLLTVDEVQVWARPMAWYVFVWAVNAFLKKRMEWKYGVQHGSFGGLDYVLRRAASTSKSQDQQGQRRPIVFLHGLGLGLFQYHLLISHLFTAFPDRDVLVPLQPHISQAIWHPRFLCPLDRHQTADLLAGLLRALGWVPPEAEGSSDEGSQGAEKVEEKAKVTVISHSNGSYVHAWLLKHSNMVARSCFVDPVSFCLWEGGRCNPWVTEHGGSNSRVQMCATTFCTVHPPPYVIASSCFCRLTNLASLGHGTRNALLRCLRARRLEPPPTQLLLVLQLALGGRNPTSARSHACGILPRRRGCDCECGSCRAVPSRARCSGRTSRRPDRAPRPGASIRHAGACGDNAVDRG
jgi:hypothetical protein